MSEVKRGAPYRFIVVMVAVLAALAVIVDQARSQPAYGPGYAGPECDGGKVCGFGYRRPHDYACLHRNGAHQGPVGCHLMDTSAHPWCATPAVLHCGTNDAMIHAYQRRYRGQCRVEVWPGAFQNFGYPPFYTGEDTAHPFAPAAMSRACKEDKFGTAATHDCTMHPNMWWVVEEFYDWNAQQASGQRSPPNAPLWPCPTLDGLPPPQPTPTPPPGPTPAPTATPAPTPAPSTCPPGWCENQVGQCSPCAQPETPTITSLTSPAPGAIEVEWRATKPHDEYDVVVNGTVRATQDGGEALALRVRLDVPDLSGVVRVAVRARVAGMVGAPSQTRTVTVAAVPVVTPTPTPTPEPTPAPTVTPTPAPCACVVASPEFRAALERLAEWPKNAQGAYTLQRRDLPAPIWQLVVAARLGLLELDRLERASACPCERSSGQLETRVEEQL